MTTSSADYINKLEWQVAELTKEKDIHQRSCEALVVCNKELNEQLAAAQSSALPLKSERK